MFRFHVAHFVRWGGGGGGGAPNKISEKTVCPQVRKFGNPRFLDVEGELIVLEGSSAILCSPATA